MKSNWMAGLALLLAAATGAAAQPAAGGSPDLGKKIALAKCVTCHGKDGKGVKSMARMFHVNPVNMDWTSEKNVKRSDEEIKKIISGGNGKMPSFKAALKDPDIDNVISYVRSLQAAGSAKSGQAK